jgi:hypothetical protein
LKAAGKTVKFYTIGKKGKDQLSRTFRNDIIHSIEPGDLGKLSFADVQTWAEDLTARFEAGEFDVAHLLFQKFVTVLTQEPTAIQLMPVAVAAGEGAAVSAGSSAPRSNMNPTRKKSSLTCCRATLPCSCCAPARKCGVGTGFEDDRNGQCHAQRGRHDQQADHPV